MTPTPPASIPGVSRETLERLICFADLLVRWTAKINLISPGDVPHLWERHILDSLQLVPLIERGARVTDLGSGGGFPGLIIAIAADAEVTLVESDRRKAAFLREASRATGCRTTVVNQRIEAANVPPAPVVTARALANLSQLLTWTEKLVTDEGYALFLKGQQAADELTNAERDWHMTVTHIPSRTPGGTILKISDIRRV
ncbi:glucose inhibited division protein B [Acetobacter aceti NRIC 0242]|uniref:Ribosomal RNA small subunit methyltransferase G n=1 Tax=Acetobacter aceti NBRC 14818 TaxID=887700 RepID=A0AB33IF99_ACEAC|nr:16S rRNA (guanine(527)-N(7))-methyltransferase RsmG [Acetobacter aceti]TCS33036.1 16S rRNA m(7)G-527 methyltransferase [Acetobacter aceti NBRC 14818]BCK76466.1 ribosomal RNA small subunit methyltransferase G [Acetobacter aceti NBRC 14818]GAN56207.1 glucose inhibited division protein B methyltransferase GidB [Acetobacter aceti NBRC 14818]GBO81619.1 glucose inhibited division protein B [Acetobacter aceti NRIC 0242]